MITRVLLLDAARTLRNEDVWSEFGRYPRADWKHDVAEGNTNLGYWEWVEHKIEAEALPE